jgi:hypothetical protein
MIPPLQGALDTLFDTSERVQDLRTLFVTLGGALMGATAIVSSLVLFSMQVNVERMPHGLFRRLSGDRRVLTAFAGAFLLALFIAALSLIPSAARSGVAVLSAAWAIFLILTLFLYTYRRALKLLNPTQQLRFVIEDARRQLRAWVRRALRAGPLFKTDAASHPRRLDPFRTARDLPRLAYFQTNAHWANGAKQAIAHAISLARRYAEHGDHEVSAAAMDAVIAINAAYVEAKGRTFFAHQLLIENPLTSDALVNNTLEQLRQTARAGTSRGDEQQIEQTLRTFAALVGVYAAIDYASPQALKTHAHLAAGYLTAEVEHLIPQNIPDVLMEGTRLIGTCANVLLHAEGPSGITTLVQKLGTIGCSGIMKEDYRAVTLTSMEQLASLDFDLLRTRAPDIGFVTTQIRESVRLIATLFLGVPDTPLASAHSAYLGPYYSVTSQQAFLAKLVQLANALADRQPNDEDARQAVHNIEEWADGLYKPQKEILLEAISQRSHFAFDMIHWVQKVTEVLVVVSNSPACEEHSRDELQHHALWLISVLSWIPDDLDTVKFVEGFQLTETLFEAAMDAQRHTSAELAERIVDLLLSWMFKAGRHASGWARLERSVYALASLALLAENDGAIPKLKAEIGKRVCAGELPDQDVADRAAREIRGRARTLYPEGHWRSAIEGLLSQVDHAKLRPLPEELADLISPSTVGQATSRSLF